MDANGTIHAGSPSASTSGSVGPPRRNAKRDRVSMACNRCQRRKQRCDGKEPCSPCSKYGSQCFYVAPTTLAASERKNYIKALEGRVADLESQLAYLGQPDATQDHFQLGPVRVQRTQSSESSRFGVDNQRDDEGNDIFIAIRDLSLSASGHYVGATSNIGISRVLTSLGRIEHGQRAVEDDDHDPAPKSAFDQSRHVDQLSPTLSGETTERLKKGWMQHIATRYPCLHTPYVLFLFQNRHDLSDLYDRCMLNLICAVSGRWLESAGEMGYFYSDQHYELALRHMEEILHLKGDRPIDYLLLLALYCTRAPNKTPGAWAYVGAAMRNCIELGLHRARPRQPPNLARELERRKFWTTYSMDRDVCIAGGRPPSISDHDIDAEMPLDVDEAEADDRVIQHAAMMTLSSEPTPYTTLTPFLHRLRLKLIESKIQHVAYRVDKPAPLSTISVDGFLEQLDDWYRNIPSQAKSFEPKPDEPYDGLEFYTIHYHRCVRLLLYPQLSVRPLNAHYLERCAVASAGVIADYRQLHRRFAVGFSAQSIQSMFMSGLTLIYCIWLSSQSILPDVEAILTDCQLLLYIVAERYPSSRKYRDLFERIKSALQREIANGGAALHGQSRLGSNASEQLLDLSQSWPLPTANDFSQMLCDMTGQVSDPLAGFAMPPGILEANLNGWWPM